MPSRRRFLGTLPALGLAAASCAEGSPDGAASAKTGAAVAAGTPGPVVVSTWRHGLAANAEAMLRMQAGASALDAAEAGVRVSELDPEVRTVGLGGYPDREGRVTLDASIMDHDGRCGAVAALEQIANPVSVARRVLEATPHVMLVGEGALRFAEAQGFARTELLTDAARRDYEAWLTERGPERPAVNVENHDTIGLLALDKVGRLAGACTTSGAAYKYAGRVGDSPIVGAGLYVDGEVGAATATGWGEAVIRASGSFLVVELMRQGLDPQAACEAAVERVVAKNPDWREIQVGFVALARDGRWGAYCIAPGFQAAVHAATGEPQLVDVASKLG